MNRIAKINLKFFLHACCQSDLICCEILQLGSSCVYCPDHPQFLHLFQLRAVWRGRQLIIGDFIICLRSKFYPLQVDPVVRLCLRELYCDFVGINKIIENYGFLRYALAQEALQFLSVVVCCDHELHRLNASKKQRQVVEGICTLHGERYHRIFFKCSILSADGCTHISHLNVVAASWDEILLPIYSGIVFFKCCIL